MGSFGPLLCLVFLHGDVCRAVKNSRAVTSIQEFRDVPWLQEIAGIGKVFTVKVMEKFTGSPKFKALVMVPEASLPSDMSYKSEGAPDAPATDMYLYWETFEEASQENGVPYAHL